MSELKTRFIDDTYVEYFNTGKHELAQIYLKSEVDKVIEEKDAKIIALNAEVFKQKHHAKLFFDERNYAETQLRRQKRKRCLAMALFCFTKGKEKLSVYKLRTFFWSRWGNRWLKLAEKFKEAK